MQLSAAVIFLDVKTAFASIEKCLIVTDPERRERLRLQLIEDRFSMFDINEGMSVYSDLKKLDKQWS